MKNPISTQGVKAIELINQSPTSRFRLKAQPLNLKC